MTSLAHRSSIPSSLAFSNSSRSAVSDSEMATIRTPALQSKPIQHNTTSTNNQRSHRSTSHSSLANRLREQLPPPFQKKQISLDAYKATFNRAEFHNSQEASETNLSDLIKRFDVLTEELRGQRQTLSNKPTPNKEDKTSLKTLDAQILAYETYNAANKKLYLQVIAQRPFYEKTNFIEELSSLKEKYSGNELNAKKEDLVYKHHEQYLTTTNKFQNDIAAFQTHQATLKPELAQETQHRFSAQLNKLQHDFSLS